MVGKCEACLILKEVEKCHIRTRGAGATNDDWEIIYMCREHHQKQHKIGWYKLSQKYPNVRIALNAKGWDFINYFGVMKLVRK